MLWEAGQDRVRQEQRGRLAELYQGFRDGYLAGLVLSGQAKPSVGYRGPSYLREEGAPDTASPQAIASQRATFGRLGRWFPNAVRKH
jgi:hypothetical protein